MTNRHFDFRTTTLSILAAGAMLFVCGVVTFYSAKIESRKEAELNAVNLSLSKVQLEGIVSTHLQSLERYARRAGASSEALWESDAHEYLQHIPALEGIRVSVERPNRAVKVVARDEALKAFMSELAGPLDESRENFRVIESNDPDLPRHQLLVTMPVTVRSGTTVSTRGHFLAAIDLAKLSRELFGVSPVRDESLEVSVGNAHFAQDRTSPVEADVVSATTLETRGIVWTLALREKPGEFISLARRPITSTLLTASVLLSVVFGVGAYYLQKARLGERLLAKSNDELREEIAERKRAQSLVGELNVALEQAVEGVCKIGLDGKLISANTALEELFEKDALVGENIFELLGARNTVALYDAIETLNESGKADTEVTFVKASGKKVFLDVAFIDPKNVGGASKDYFYCFLRNMTYRNKALDEEKLRAQVFESLKLAVFMLSPRGEVLLVNPYGERALGYGDGELNGLHASRLLNGTLDIQPYPFLSLYEKVEGGQVWQGSLALYQKDGGFIMGSAQCRAVEMSGDKCVFINVALGDTVV